MKYPLLIFDLDGTLAHTAPDLINTLNRICRPFNIDPVGLENVGQVVGQGAKAMIQRAFDLNDKIIMPEELDKLFDTFLIDYAENLANETRLFDGLKIALDQLEQDGYTFCVCTNKREGMAVKLIAKLGVSHRFVALTGGDTFSFRKPDPNHLIETAKRAGFEISKAIMIGDSSTDINAARNAVIPSIAVTFGYSDIPVDQLGASAVIDNYAELSNALSWIEKNH